MMEKSWNYNRSNEIYYSYYTNAIVRIQSKIESSGAVIHTNTQSVVQDRFSLSPFADGCCAALCRSAIYQITLQLRDDAIEIKTARERRHAIRDCRHRQDHFCRALSFLGPGSVPAVVVRARAHSRSKQHPHRVTAPPRSSGP